MDAVPTSRCSIQTRSRSAATRSATQASATHANTTKDTATSTPAASRSKKASLDNSQRDHYHEHPKPSTSGKRKRADLTEVASDVAPAEKTARSKASGSNLVRKTSCAASDTGAQSKEQEDTEMKDVSAVSAVHPQAACTRANKKRAAAKKGKAQGRAPWR